MEFPLASQLVSRLDWRAEVDSTNTRLLEEAAADQMGQLWPDFSVLIAGFQSAGKGRAGRSWEADPGSSLFASLLLRLDDRRGISAAQLPLLPMVVGLALLEALDPWLPPGAASLKWPNDIMVGERKLAGVLLELSPGADLLVIGTGANLLQAAGELSHPTAISLAIAAERELDEAATPDGLVDRIMSGYLARLKTLIGQLEADPKPVREAIAARLATLQSRIRAIFPDGSERLGLAEALTERGALLVRFDGASEQEAILVADIKHLRHEPAA